MSINIQTLEDQVSSILRSFITESLIIVKQDNAPIPSTPFIAFKFGALDTLGRAEFRGPSTAKEMITRHPITIDFQSYRDNTRTDINTVRTNILSNPLIRDQFTLVGIDPLTVTELVPTPSIIDDKWEQGSTFTLNAYIADTTTLDLGEIVTSEITACYDTTGDGETNIQTTITVTGEPE